MLDSFGRILQRASQIDGAGPVPVQEMERHPLGALGAHAGQALERVDELRQQRRIRLGHQNGSFIPGGNIPPVTFDI